MTIAVTTLQVGNDEMVIQWTTTDADPALGFEVAVDINTAGFIGLATVSGTSRQFIDGAPLWVPGDSIQYRVKDVNTTTEGLSAVLVANDLMLPYTYGPIDNLATVPRYTTLDDVKQAIGVPLTNTDKDEQLTEAIISGENAIDRELGRSFPDQGSNPQIQGVPQAIRNLAKKAAVAVYTGDHSPFGEAGSDEWLGAISVADAVSKTIRRSPLLRGFQVTFGFAS